MENYANGGSIPLGLGMALAQDANAMHYFAALPQNEQQKIIEHTHCIKSKNEMRSYVHSLSVDGGSALS